MSDADPDVFQAYLNCVYAGPETLEEIPGAFEREVRGGAIGSTTLYVYNVCEGATREIIVQLFEEVGDIKAVHFDKHASAQLMYRCLHRGGGRGSHESP